MRDLSLLYSTSPAVPHCCFMGVIMEGRVFQVHVLVHVLVQVLVLPTVTGLHTEDLLSYGPQSGDVVLAEGDDETSRVLSLPRPLYFYNSLFSQLYVATNGIISAQDLPMEKQYVDDGFPTDFPVVAPFLADIDTSGGRGQIYYRVTETPGVLNRVAQEVHRGFPDAKFTPTHAVVATWEKVAAYQDPARRSGLPPKVNTFQAVMAYDESDSYVLFLYPEDGLNFYGTRPKESYNVEIDFPARVGFSRGEVTYLIFSRTEGPHYSVTSDEQSVRSLSRVGNTGIPGLWLFHVGNRYSFNNIVPASVGGTLATPPPGGHFLSKGSTTPEYAELEEYSDYTFDPNTQEEEEEEDYPLTGGNQEHQPSSNQPPPPVEESDPQPQVPAPEEQRPQLPLEDVYPPHKNLPPLNPPLAPGGHVVSVDEEDVDLDTGVIQYTTENKETCARFQQQCSQNAFCSDYTTGYCCHCSAGFYGNGRHCLPDGAPQRVSGKVSGSVTTGTSTTQLNNIDLHAYIVVGDGRAYTAISQVPEAVGWALMPVAPIGELFGWLFALELPNSQSGFKNTGAQFTRHAEVRFYPGNQRLTITQTGRGLDDHNHLSVDTVLSGSVPTMVEGAEVTMEPFKETYQYYPNVVTSTSVREYAVTSAERGSESFSFQIKQNITYGDCRHDNRAAAAAETLQITMERVFVMYVKEERILRYAITNKISPVGVEPSGPELINPCYSGTHDCDTTAQCVPQDGQAYLCQCATGYRGDGRNCYDVDECAESLNTCGAHSQCVNLAGSHRCQCQTGYEFGFDGRTCVDVDECGSSPCHPSARCLNELGSFQCRCQLGFYGDGFQCSQQEVPTPRPISQCEQHRDNLQHSKQPLGAFVPQCDANGRYRALQCHGSTGHCWCVDSRGQERPGTRTAPGTPPTDCDRPDEPVRPKTQCENHRDGVHSSEGPPVVGAYVPQCDAEGRYTALQCHASTGHCWCVDSRGTERAGTRTPPGTAPRDCDRPDEPQRPKTQCEQHRERVQSPGPEGRPVPGTLVPQCDSEGRYRPQQCHGSTGHCWCVDSRGQERPGTRTTPGTPPIDCDRPDEPQRPQTPCEQHRERLQASDGLPLVGAYVPQCHHAHGHYLPRQCHASTGHCWCVDSRGQERPGTRTAPGTPPIDCDRPDEPQRPQTPCEQHRERLQASDGLPLVGAYVPQCHPHGHYLPRQCHASTGHCWCVDSRGQERPGTRTTPGTPPIDCDRPDEPQRPQTPCEQHRERLQASDGLPLVGAYVPQCHAHGHYLPRQCHASTGHCWCVDSRGEERPGTRTAPGTPPIDCDRPERAQTVCERTRDGPQSSSSGAFVPQCDAEGHFLPRQCHGSTGHCWCVDSRGEERPGTRTTPGSPSVDCHRPVAPATPQPESVCQRWRASLIEHYGGKAEPQQYVPQCEPDGQFSPVQCYGETTYCWCVDQDGREVPGTRSNDVVKPACISTVAPPTVRPLPRPSVTPPPSAATTLLYAQGQKIGALPLDGTKLDPSQSKTLLTLHGSIVVGIAYDCKENKVYWTDLSARTIHRAAMVPGAEPEILINSNLVSPEGLAVDVKRRLMFWVDSTPDVIERANLDGSGRRSLFDMDLVNPRAIIVVSSTGTLYWTDWNREAPKIERATVDGTERRVLVSDGVGLPNALTHDPSTGHICWADAGTKRLECISPDGSGRKVLHSNLNYPFSMVYYRQHFYYTDWRRDGVIVVSKGSSQFTDEYLPEQRSHLYGITVATTHC
ncbi:LOW QUALITY PROTEIN: nidogen-2 [Gouania willdenowi]|uniref:LOW QUALITY PROTEIN: nidogen-2 n=1 Tax=Gouania willdenowi TaxID=441366 RepID=UPI0010559223|nr:LOW QUALITY PROTEIN: nidogen-2 [Gouania willdenowi]